MEGEAIKHANRCEFLSDFPHDWNSEKNGFINGAYFAEKWTEVSTEPPPYYGEVIVECEDSQGCSKEHYVAFLSRDDVWFIYGLNIVLTKEVIRWRFLSVC